MTNRIAVLGLTLFLGLGFTGCDTADPASDTASANTPTEVEITALHDHEEDEHLFSLSTDEIPSDWTTFTFDNQSHADHFVLVSKVPDTIDVPKYRNEVVHVVQNFLDSILENEISFPNAGFEFPGWYADVRFMGGPGLTAPERTSQTTVDLMPGTYILECYVKTSDGTHWHHTMGMLAKLTVTDEITSAEAPASTLSMTLRNPENGGIEADDVVSAGTHTVAVQFAEQQVYSTGGQNDVHLARLTEDTDLEALGAWMNPLDPAGFVSPPAPATFLGGVEDQPAGTTGYLTVDLSPGRYAWIAEVPDPAGKDMLKTFTVE
jgi:hypothetical protein